MHRGDSVFISYVYIKRFIFVFHEYGLYGD